MTYISPIRFWFVPDDVRIKEANIAMLRSMYPSENRLSVYRGDICDADFMEDLFEKERPKWVCHMAARAGVRPSIQDPYVYIHSNITGTTQLMELSHKFGVENFVFASSSSVYGGSKSTFFSEEESVDNPVSPYAASKKACELLAYTYHHLYQLNITGLRFFTVFGPRGRPDMAPFKFIDRVSRGVEIQQFGDGSSSRDYTYISDIVDGIVRAIDRPHKYEIFNLGKGSGTSLKEFIDLVQKHTGKKAIIRVMPDQPGDVPYTVSTIPCPGSSIETFARCVILTQALSFHLNLNSVLTLKRRAACLDTMPKSRLTKGFAALWNGTTMCITRRISTGFVPKCRRMDLGVHRPWWTLPPLPPSKGRRLVQI